ELALLTDATTMTSPASSKNGTRREERRPGRKIAKRKQLCSYYSRSLWVINCVGGKKARSEKQQREEVEEVALAAIAPYSKVPTDGNVKRRKIIDFLYRSRLMFELSLQIKNEDRR
ncbi:hypothetical protein U1Q18_052210, partial [Sarracenia purpurea var. burkii]